MDFWKHFLLQNLFVLQFFVLNIKLLWDEQYSTFQEKEDDEIWYWSLPCIFLDLYMYVQKCVAYFTIFFGFGPRDW